MQDAFSHSRFTVGEEIAHAITHGVGALGSLVGLVWLVVVALPSGSLTVLAAVAVFGLTMAVLYTASTLYHALTAVRAKRVFELLDHGAIYLLIAGTYTPFCLITLGGGLGWTLFGLAWGLAVVGILYEVVLGRPWKRLSLLFYLALGWLILIAIEPLMAALPAPAVRLLLLGGLAYTGGTVFYAWRGFPYHHGLWHLCVLAGTALHYVCVLRYVVPDA